MERPNISLNAKVTRSIFLTASSGKTGLLIFLGMSVFCVAQPCALLKICDFFKNTAQRDPELQLIQGKGKCFLGCPQVSGKEAEVSRLLLLSGSSMGKAEL